MSHKWQGSEGFDAELLEKAYENGKDAVTTKAAAHTPGPWKEFAPAIENDNSGPIVDETYRSIQAGKNGYFDEKKPDDGFCLTGFITPDNARLIAAAAEMLEALEDILRIAQKDSVPKRTIAERAEAAIQKAGAQ